MTRAISKTDIHDNLVTNKKEIRENYLDPMDVPINITQKSPVFGLIVKSISKTLNRSKYEFKKMENDIKIAIRLEAKLQKLKEGHGSEMPAHEFIKELGKW